MTSSADRDAGCARSGRLAQAIAERELDWLLVESLVDLRYLSGFTGSHGAALIRAGGAQEGGHRFFTDFRYETQSAEQVGECFEREIVSGELIEAIGAVLAGGQGRLGFDEAAVSVKTHRLLAERLGGGWELVPTTGVVEELRVRKEPLEIERIRAASELADEALRVTLERGLLGRSERELAIELELNMRRLGAEGPSFPSIVAAGAHAALPHATPSEQEIPADVLVTIDWGAVLDGYCSDCTRTYASGEGISALARDTYALVLEAQERGVGAVTAGPSGREVDGVAREVIQAAGRGEQFGHGLGHGVGLEIHEAPRLSRIASEEPLQAGSVVTVEPGVYLPGELGVRIEDLLVVTEGEPLVLTGLPKALTVIA